MKSKNKDTTAWYVFWRVLNDGGIPAEWSRLHRDGGGDKTLCGLKMDEPGRVGRRTMKHPPRIHTLPVCIECARAAEKELLGYLKGIQQEGAA